MQLALGLRTLVGFVRKFCQRKSVRKLDTNESIAVCITCDSLK
jgi:hypothetical protein